MKIKLLVLALAVSPAMALLGQEKVVLYNQGMMSVVGSNSNNTVLYIDGDFVSSDDAAKTAAPQILLKNSKTVLTGNLVHNSTLDNSNVFTHASNDASIFEFRGAGVQKITTTGTTYDKIPSKKTSYINFPNVVVNNQLAVDVAASVYPEISIDPALAVVTKDLNLTRGTLVVDGVRLTTGTNGNSDKFYASNNMPSYYQTVGVGKTASTQRTILAHLKVDGNVVYGTDLTTNDRGFVEVKVPFTPTSEYSDKGGALMGFGSPYKQLGVDYFMFNYVFAPNHYSYLGDAKVTMFDPTLTLQPGRGYIIGNGLRGDNFANYTESNIVNNLTAQQFANRATDTYIFNRVKLRNVATGSLLFQKDASTYNNEVLNNENVTIKLNPGYNYIANPYTTPIDVSALLGTGAVTDWGVNVGPANASGANVHNAIWLMNETSRGSALHTIFPRWEYPNNILPGKTVQVDMRFHYASASGSTYISDDAAAGQVIIAPLQMFLVYAYTDNASITIPKSARVTNKQSMIRSTSNNVSYDDVAIEVIDTKTQTTDRVGFVLRPQAEIISNVNYRDVPRFNSVEELDKPNLEVKNSIASALFAKSADGTEVSVKYVGYTPNADIKVTVPLNLRPSVVNQEIVIRGLKLETVKNFETVTLVDNLLKKSIVMTPETVYKTTTKSSDNEDRFTLVFEKGTVGIEDEIQEQSKSISSYYSNGTLTVAGFDESDFNSNLGVYDIQGRLLTQAKVNDFTVKVSQNLAPGAYIVKVVGNNSYVAKFLVK